jgi:hypothetical protein
LRSKEGDLKVGKRDNAGLTLMIYRSVNLLCDGEKLELRYRKPEGEENGVWFQNGENTGLQVSALVKQLREKYKSIRVTWKRQY